MSKNLNFCYDIISIQQLKRSLNHFRTRKQFTSVSNYSHFYYNENVSNKFSPIIITYSHDSLCLRIVLSKHLFKGSDASLLRALFIRNYPKKCKNQINFKKIDCACLCFKYSKIDNVSSKINTTTIMWKKNNNCAFSRNLCIHNFRFLNYEYTENKCLK